MFIYMKLNGVDLSVIHSSNYYKYIFKVSIFGLFCFFYFFSFHRINIYLSAWNLRQMEIYVVPHIRCNTIFEVKFIVCIFFFFFYVANKVLISIISAAVYLFVLFVGFFRCRQITYTPTHCFFFLSFFTYFEENALHLFNYFFFFFYLLNHICA